MNVRLLHIVEDDISNLDLNRLTRARLLLQSDHWSAEARLDHRQSMAPGKIAALEAERKRIRGAIDKIDVRIEELSMEEVKEGERALRDG